MHRHIKQHYHVVLLTLAATCMFGITASAEKPSDKELAQRLVGTCVSVQPGDVVVVAGGKHTIPLMEEVAMAAQEAGGQVRMFLSSDRVDRARWADIPEEYLEYEPRYLTEWMKHIDVWIGLPNNEDRESVRAGVSESRRAKIAQGSKLIKEAVSEVKERGVFVGMATRQSAQSVGVDFEVLDEMHWQAIIADYAKIAQQGAQLARLLEEGKTVQVTSPAGTDFSASLGKRPASINDGVVSPDDVKGETVWGRFVTLPGGRVSVAPLETSANGVVVIPREQFRSKPVRNSRFELTDGQLKNFRAEEGEADFKEMLSSLEGAQHLLAGIGIGLNPALRAIEADGAEYRPGNAAGMVTIRFGNNRLLGGANNVAGLFDVHITDATVTVDGNVVVKDGKLVL